MALNLVELIRKRRATAVRLPKLLLDMKYSPFESVSEECDTEAESMLYLQSEELVRSGAAIPDLVSILQELAATVLESSKARFGRHIDTAISTRQGNSKTEYIRAFWHKLNENKIFTTSVSIRKAMAAIMAQLSAHKHLRQPTKKDKKHTAM